MAIWSKKSAPAKAEDDAPVPPAQPLSAKPQTPPQNFASSATPAAAPTPAVATHHPDQAAPARPGEAQKRLEAAFGALVMLMSTSPTHRGHTIANLEGLLAAPLRLGQFVIAEANDKQKGYLGPVAAILWADVSPEVDARLTGAQDGTYRLRPDDWKSGDIRWIIDILGDQKVAGQILQRLVSTDWLGQTPKVRLIGGDGKAVVGRVQAGPPPAAASPA